MERATMKIFDQKQDILKSYYNNRKKEIEELEKTRKLPIEDDKNYDKIKNKEINANAKLVQNVDSSPSNMIEKQEPKLSVLQKLRNRNQVSNSKNKDEIKIKGIEKETQDDKNEISSLINDLKKQLTNCNYQGCKNKLNWTDQECNYCHLSFCSKHSLYEIHGCEKGLQAYKERMKNRIRESNDQTHVN